MTLFTLPGSFLATGVYNLDSSRFQAALRDTRKEGWTEAWGADEKDISDLLRYELDEESVSTQLATQHPQEPLVLTQFRPAWVEQVILCMAKIPHVVVNANYVTSEATGPLPYLRDHEQSTQPPMLVGRQHPSNISTPNPIAQNHILEYLKSTRNVDLDRSLKLPEQKSLSKCLLNLIESELNLILLFLRYEDHDAWEQVYRRQYLHATSPRSASWFSQLHGRFQASMERVTYRRRLMEINRVMTVPRAVERAKEAYAAIEQQLDKNTSNPFLMGIGGQPTLVDAVLWAHLAEAFCDVHLVVLLADFPKIIEYFQDIFQRYFGGTAKEKWEEWNQTQNRQNAFQQLPLWNNKKKLNASGFKDAIDLMQKLSLRNQDLEDVLRTTKAQRASEPWPSLTPATETPVYRWRMGEDLAAKASQGEYPDPSDSPMRKKLIRDQMRNDQAWISGVIGISAIAILLLQGARNTNDK